MLRRGCKRAFKTCALRVKRLNLINILAFFVILFIAVKFVSCTPTLTKKIITEPLYSPEAYTKEGLLHYQKRDFEQAIAYFKKAIESNMHYQPAHSYLALSYSYLGKKERAIQEFKKVVEIGPNTDDAISAQKWLKRLSEELTVIGVLSFHSARRFQVWEGLIPVTNRPITYRGLATRSLIKFLEKDKMYKAVDLSNTCYSQLKSDYTQYPPSSPELGRLTHLASKNGAQLLLIPRIDYLSVSGKPPSVKGNKVNLGIIYSGEVTMSVAVYSCKSQKLVITVSKDSSKIPWYSAPNYIGGLKALFNSCSEEVLKELLKHVL